MTIEEEVTRAWLRSCLPRNAKVYEAGGAEKASASVTCLMAEGGGSRYHLPDELPGDRSLACNIPEVKYLNRMGSYLFFKNAPQRACEMRGTRAVLLQAARFRAASERSTTCVCAAPSFN